MKNIYDYALSILSTYWSLENINSVLGIILLILSICNILYKAYLQIYDKIKNKKYKEVSDVIENTIEDIEKLKEDI